MSIPVIDLFAGPGGLGEGFTALHRANRPVFKIGISIEKEAFAHRTLELRALFRQFQHRKPPSDYYDYIAGRISRERLFANHASKAEVARREAWNAELGAAEFPPTVVDNRIREALGGVEDWVLIGGPPCQAYSLVGRSRRKNDPTFAEDKKHLLYEQYLRILAVHRPPVFVMENVKGMLSAKVNEDGIFERIRNDLTNPLPAVPEADQTQTLGYKLYPLVKVTSDLLGEYAPEDFVVRAEDFGIPQARHRVILLGIRTDLDVQPRALHSTAQIPIEKAIGDLPRLRSGLSKEDDSPENWLNAIRAIKASSVLQDPCVSPKLRKAIKKTLKKLRDGMNRGGEFVSGNPDPKFARNWIRDPELKGFCNHATRGHIREDLHRYLYAAQYARQEKKSLGLEHFPPGLLPKHENVAAAIDGAMFNDRFRVQHRGRPSTTVTSHISKDGHYFIHYDPTQCRSLTVREAARLQTFPDNYFFEGPRTAQYQQVGNAVPPLLAYKIARLVADLF